MNNDVAVMVLGTAQDGGYPHLNCKNQCCKLAWNNPSVYRLTFPCFLCNMINQQNKKLCSKNKQPNKSTNSLNKREQTKNVLNKHLQ